MAEPRQAQWEQARTLYPSSEYASRIWADYFEEYPDVLTKVLGDLYRVYKTEEAKRAGEGNPAGGRRRSHVNGNLEELWAIITPRYSMEPFEAACRELMGTHSLRGFAMRVPIDHRELSRLLRGTSRLSVFWMEQIARAADVHPAYFLEWRVQTISTIVTTALTEQPHLSVGVLKSLGRRAT